MSEPHTTVETFSNCTLSEFVSCTTAGVSAARSAAVATVNAVPTFTEHTAVADGASDLFVAVFGDAGRHARLAVGVSSLPADMAIEVQATVDIR